MSLFLNKMNTEITPESLLKWAETFEDGVKDDIRFLGIIAFPELCENKKERDYRVAWFILRSGTIWQATCRLGGSCRTPDNLEPGRTLYGEGGKRRETLTAEAHLKTFKEAERNMAARYQHVRGGRDYDNWCAMQEEWLSPLIRKFFEPDEEEYV
jgi:hypothetical protein